MSPARPRVPILCTANSARSQMAEGLLRHDAGAVLDVESAGTHPASVRPEAIAVMRELGIDISTQRSKSVDEFVSHTFDLVLTVCDDARETCPMYSGHAVRRHRAFRDPAAVDGSAAERLAAFRETRDALRAYLRELAAELTRDRRP